MQAVQANERCRAMEHKALAAERKALLLKERNDYLAAKVFLWFPANPLSMMTGFLSVCDLGPLHY